jgi:hypothetical protein
MYADDIIRAQYLPAISKMFYDRERDKPAHEDKRMVISVHHIHPGYVDDNILAFTVPSASMRFICKQPDEKVPYEELDTLMRHEIIHNTHEYGMDEDFVTKRARNPASSIEASRARLVYRP